MIRGWIGVICIVVLLTLATIRPPGLPRGDAPERFRWRRVPIVFDWVEAVAWRIESLDLETIE